MGTSARPGPSSSPTQDPPARLNAIRRAVMAFALGCLALFASIATGASASPEAAALAAQHDSMQPRLAASPFERPLAIESTEGGERVQGTIFGELQHPFEPLAAHLTSPAEWCAVVRLHINVKGCVPEQTAEGDFVTVYGGRKFYEPLSRAHPIRYRFQVASVRSDYLRIVLAATTGPFGTGDYALELEAAPIGTRTFAVLRYGFRTSAVSRWAVSGYLASAGRDKAGFTVTGHDRAGHPLLVGGVRGVVERNAMRNFLALDAWLDSLSVPAPRRFERSVERMAALTDQYPAQLVEMPAAEFRSIKIREWKEQDEQAALALASAPAQPGGMRSEPSTVAGR